MKEKLAILVPTFNGGEHLAASVCSCEGIGLAADEYEVLVLDNHSSDGSTDRLPNALSNGARVRVIRNTENLGRIGNWNRAVEVAEERGFRWAGFLFVGDRYIPGGGLPEVIEKLREAEAGVGLSRVLVLRESDGRTLYLNRASFDGTDVVLGGGEFLEVLLRSGSTPLGPLQGSVFDLQSGARLVFDSNRPIDTDVQSTLRYIAKAGRNVLLTKRSFMQWTSHERRFTSTLAPEAMGQVVADCVRVAEDLTGKQANWEAVRTVQALNAVAHELRILGRRGVRGVAASLWQARREIGRASIPHLSRMLAAKLFLGRSIVHIGRADREMGEAAGAALSGRSAN
jgi:hypothetical protein